MTTSGGPNQRSGHDAFYFSIESFLTRLSLVGSVLRYKSIRTWEETDMTLQQGVNAQVLDARCAPRLRTVAGWITLATVAVAVWTVPASARFAPFGGAPFDQAAIDSAMAEPDLVYALARPTRRSNTSAPATACSGRRRRSISWLLQLISTRARLPRTANWCGSAWSTCSTP